MKELSLHILDIAENSVNAGASQIKIFLFEDSECLTVTVADNGCGMTKKQTALAVNPFYTTRKTRNYGMGIPLFALAAKMTGGCITLTSHDAKTYPQLHGTRISAKFYKNHIDCAPLGDMSACIVTLVHSSPDIDFYFEHKYNGAAVSLDTRKLKDNLDDMPINDLSVLKWIREYISDQYSDLKKQGKDENDENVS